MLKSITGSVTMSIGNSYSYNGVLLPCVLFFLLICFVIFNEIKRKEIKKLKHSIEMQGGIS